MVDSVIAWLQNDLNENAVQVRIADLKTLPTIEADAEQLKWVFTNLVKNAMQAMPRGGTLTISGKVNPSENTVHLQFSDTGIGMSPDVVERVFDPFFTTKDTGTGLGLAVAKRFLENHSATIECLSEEGKGTTFAISLPIAQRNTISG